VRQDEKREEGSPCTEVSAAKISLEFALRFGPGNSVQGKSVFTKDDLPNCQGRARKENVSHPKDKSTYMEDKKRAD